MLIKDLTSGILFLTEVLGFISLDGAFVQYTHGLGEPRYLSRYSDML
jgi:hypothetical protein